MQAYAITQYGEPEYFTPIEVAKPAIKPGHLLIKVAATSVNPVDTKIRAGGRAMCPDLPAVLHMDVAGTVAEVGEGVTAFKEGDEVYGCSGGVKTVAGENLGGALGDYILVDADLIALKPKSLSLFESAALPLVTITAWEALIDRCKTQLGQTVLVHAATGGVGHIGIQLAKAAGATVFTTASTEQKTKLAHELGADVVINYRQQSVDDYVAEHTAGQGFDVVLDTIGGETLANSCIAAKVNGTVATIQGGGGTHDLGIAHFKNLTLHLILMLVPVLYERGRAAHGEILRKAATLVDDGKLKPLIDSQAFTFAEVADAHRKLTAGQAIGKIVLRHPSHTV